MNYKVVLPDFSAPMRTARGDGCLGAGGREWKPGPGIWALTGLCSLASNSAIQLKIEEQTLEGTAQEVRGGSVALQERSVKIRELQEENQLLRKQVPVGGVWNIRASRWPGGAPRCRRGCAAGRDAECRAATAAGHESSWSRVPRQHDCPCSRVSGHYGRLCAPWPSSSSVTWVHDVPL